MSSLSRDILIEVWGYRMKIPKVFPNFLKTMKNPKIFPNFFTIMKGI